MRGRRWGAAPIFGAAAGPGSCPWIRPSQTLDTRGNIAIWTARCGDIPEALRLFRELLPDRARILGPTHPSVQGIQDVITTLGRQ
jgi:hypothetical protein